MIRRGRLRGSAYSTGPAPGSARSRRGRDPHEVLGVGPRASAEEIVSAYRDLVRQYHPDKFTDMPKDFRDVAEQKMKEINAAYEELKRRDSP